MTVRYSTDFTVGANTDLSAFDGGVWTYIRNNGLQVNAASGHVRDPSETGNDIFARCEAPGVPTGDQQISANVRVGSSGSGAQGQIGCRFVANNGYVMFRENGTTVSLYRIDGGSYALLQQINGSFPDHTVFAVRMRARNLTGPDRVEINWEYGGVQTTYDDTSANRITSGQPGIGVYNFGGGPGNAYVDDVVIDDLVVASPAIEGNAIAQAVAQAALTTGIRLQAAAAAVALAMGHVNALLQGTAQGQATAIGQLGGTELAALAQVQATLTGLLTGVAAQLQVQATAEALAQASFNDRTFRIVGVRQDYTLMQNEGPFFYAWFPSIAAMRAAAIAAGGASGEGFSFDSNGILQLPAPGALSPGEDQGFGVVSEQDATPDDAERAYVGAFDVV